MKKLYRKCVGMMIINDNKDILVGRRLDHPSGFWQMPQGGIDEGESPENALYRELYEETGLKKETVENMNIIPHTRNCISELKRRGIQIGVTTGFNKKKGFVTSTTQTDLSSPI